MANSSFQYTTQFLTSIERTISRERLHRYLVAAHGNRVKALELYEFNVAISEALYGYLHGLEIAIKNAIHHELNRAYGTPHWYDCAPLSPHHQSKFLQEAKKKAGQNVPAGKVIAELAFAFWTGLVAHQYNWTIWVPHLHKAFPHAKTPRNHVFRRLEAIRNLRNRIAHHERILTSYRRLWAGHQSHITLPEISECAEWICPDTARWLAAKFRYTEAGVILLKVSTMGVNLA